MLHRPLRRIICSSSCIRSNVSDIHFDDITVVNGVYASRFKSWIGGQGLAQNITWSNIRVYNVTFPIFVTQTYINQGGSQTQLEDGSVVDRPNNSTVNMHNFAWTNFTGACHVCMRQSCHTHDGLGQARSIPSNRATGAAHRTPAGTMQGYRT